MAALSQPAWLMVNRPDRQAAPSPSGRGFSPSQGPSRSGNLPHAAGPSMNQGVLSPTRGARGLDASGSDVHISQSIQMRRAPAYTGPSEGQDAGAFLADLALVALAAVAPTPVGLATVGAVSAGEGTRQPENPGVYVIHRPAAPAPVERVADTKKFKPRGPMG